MVTVLLGPKITVEREESHPLQAMKEWKDHPVVQAWAADLNTYLSMWDFPLFKQRALVRREVFVKQVQAALARRGTVPLD